MPSGIYPRTENQLKAAVKNLALGRTPEVRAKVRKKMIKKGKDPKWRKLVSEQTKKAMHRPEVRKKHLKGLAKARATYGNNFKGGNGREMTPIIKLADKLFSHCGFVREYAVKTKPVKHLFERIPDAYKIDFGNPERMIAIEMDGVCHKSAKQKRLDQKKNKVLKALRWRVVRLNHE